MLEGFCNMWNLLGKVSALVITTNGFVKSNGACVMGRGSAREARDKFPGIDFILGKYLKAYGNRPFVLKKDVTSIVSMPVKPEYGTIQNLVAHMKNRQMGSVIPGWAVKADIRIIKQSAVNLVRMANKFQWETIAMPRPGCGAGELDWPTVRSVLDPILDDRFTAYTYGSYK